MEKRRVLILVVAYNAERTIRSVLNRIPEALFSLYQVEVLIIDDASHDQTFETALSHAALLPRPFQVTVLVNPVNQGYGGNQQLGLHYAVEQGFDVVALLHGDGQYAPEYLPQLIAPLAAGQADLVLGSRMLHRLDALRGGMPLYKFIGNITLTTYQNAVLGLFLSEYHSGYRLYAVAALRRLPFHLNSQDFHFDSEIIIQMARAGGRILEIPIPTFYGDEICYVNGLRYAWDVVRVSTQAMLHKLGLSYQARFDLAPPAQEGETYVSKLAFASSHSEIVAAIAPGSRVVDIGCGQGHVAAALRAKGCRVTGLDAAPPRAPEVLDEFYRADLDQLPLPLSLAPFDWVILGDVVEHLREPERFMRHLREESGLRPQARVIVTTGNVAFVVVRLMLLLGLFNYAKRGILDLTHHRLFTFHSLRGLLEECGFSVTDCRGIAAPYPLVCGDGWLGRGLLALNRGLIALARGLFSYQICLTAQPRPTLGLLLQSARHFSGRRQEQWREQSERGEG